ncbi:MAG: hypothetical protein PHR87_11135 [Sulfurospirillaceae bacterium]|nr:hypothetical protein [Sulfurospirillaceae bacterium]
MIYNRTLFEKILSLLQGASWALAILGGLYAFLLFYPFGFLTASLIAIFLFLMGFFFVVVFEVAQIQIEKLEELKKQTKLMEKLTQNLPDETLSHY